MYQYRAEVLRVLDGDTIHARVDLGFNVYQDMTLRLAHIDAPERGTPEGTAATEFVREWMGGSPSIVIETIRDRKEKFGRYLAEIYRRAGEDNSLNDEMVLRGHAVPYAGGRR